MKIDSRTYSINSGSRGTTAIQIRSLKWNVLGTDRSQPHLLRKAYHCLMGLACFALYAFVLSREEATALLGVIGGSWILCDIIRFRSTKLNQATLKVFGSLMRREELTQLTANTFFILGLIAIVPVFSKPVVLLSVLYLAIGDPIAAIVGTRWGKNRLIGKKSLEGSLANFAAAFLATFLLATLYLDLAFPSALALSAVGASTSFVAEALPTPINDNFTIPVASSLLLTAVLHFFPLI